MQHLMPVELSLSGQHKALKILFGVPLSHKTEKQFPSHTRLTVSMLINTAKVGGCPGKRSLGAPPAAPAAPTAAVDAVAVAGLAELAP
jgi:hypothetical protein